MRKGCHTFNYDDAGVIEFWENFVIKKSIYKKSGFFCGNWISQTSAYT